VKIEKILLKKKEIWNGMGVMSLALEAGGHFYSIAGGHFYSINGGHFMTR